MKTWSYNVVLNIAEQRMMSLNHSDPFFKKHFQKNKNAVREKVQIWGGNAVFEQIITPEKSAVLVTMDIRINCQEVYIASCIILYTQINQSQHE